MRSDACDRRHFLKNSTAAVAATSLAGLGFSGLGLAQQATAAATGSERKYKKSLKVNMVRVEGTLLEKFKLLKKLGYDGIELNSPNNLDLKEVLKARDESGLLIPGVVDSVHWKDRLSDPDPAVRAKGVTALKAAIAQVKQYGGTSVLLVPGKKDAKANYQQCWDRSQAEIRKVIPLAEDQGIHILMENVWNDFLVDAGETAKFIDQLDSKMVGAYFDVGNAVRYAPPADWIRTLGSRIIKLDIKDYSLTLGKKNLYAGFKAKLGEGDSNWPEVMKALREVGYTSGWGSAEVPGGGEERLKEISQRMDRCFES